LEPGVSQM